MDCPQTEALWQKKKNPEPKLQPVWNESPNTEPENQRNANPLTHQPFYTFFADTLNTNTACDTSTGK